MRSIRTCLVLIVSLILPAALAVRADASCNLVAGTSITFGGAQGTTNRPFAAPGEAVEVALRTCDDSAGLTPTVGDHLVTIIYEPPSGARSCSRPPPIVRG